MIDINTDGNEPLSTQMMDEYLMGAQETTDAEENYNKTVGVGSYYSSTVHKISPFRSFKSILPNMDKTNKSMVPGKLRTRTLVHGASADSIFTAFEPEGAQ